jgi:hypothetical protein
VIMDDNYILTGTIAAFVISLAGLAIYITA